MLILALPGADALGAALAASIGCEWSALAVHGFPDGETLVRIDAPVQGRCVVLAGSLDRPDGKTLPLLFAADAARELGASEVGLVAPYLAYLRQDARFQPGQAITSRSYARLLSGSLDFLVTVDPHLHRWRSLEEIYPIRTHVVTSAPAIAQWLRTHVQSPLVVGPDAESVQWASEVARLADAPWTAMQKKRECDERVHVQLDSSGAWAGRTPVLLDDIASSGATLVAAAAALRKAGLPPPIAIAVHALLSADAQDRLSQAGLRRFISCDTVPHPSNGITLLPWLAQAVRLVTAS